MSKVLVAGVNGFVGHHVARQLYENEHTVIGVGNQPKVSDELKPIVRTYYGLDLTSDQEVRNIELNNLDAIINLAGFAKVGDSKGKGELYEKVNVGVHTTLYKGCLRQGVSPRILAISTGAVYDPHQDLPITETSALVDDAQTNEYVVSKKKLEVALQPLKKQGLDIIIARPFNHSGPGQLPGFLIPDLGEQIKEAAENNTPLKVGNLTTKRDYTDVRDVARAYVDLATRDKSNLKHGVYNVCSGKSVAGTEILELLKKAFNAPGVKTEIDESRIRKNDIMEIYGSRTRITEDIGWEPMIPVEKMIDDYAAWKKLNA
ncbi:MAG: NAD(P)-dependent oxidoreductase [Candidatus Saccharibacteria bacterium]|nr:NAD(P)-dependent oxidoreductase [Candidatus Saccharibacteria bacterium]